MRRVDEWLLRIGTARHRLIGIALFRLIIGACGVEYYVSDLSHRNILWGPRGYISPGDAKAQLAHPLFSIYLCSSSQTWFELCFFTGLGVAIAFTLCGGRALTLVHAVFIWSIYNRNQDVLEGGDNLVRITVIFMLLVASNHYLAPGARGRRARAAERLTQTDRRTPSLSILAHNVAVALVVFQIVVVYAMAGYYKLTGSIWNTGVAMYYISHINQFRMFAFYPHLMDNLWVGWLVSTMTIVFECAVPFIVFTQRRWLREIVIAGLESMHVGIIVFMGLVAFGAIMVGADFALLKDDDYRSLGATAGALRSWVGTHSARRSHPQPGRPERAPAELPVVAGSP
jgi:hypothetical protein